METKMRIIAALAIMLALVACGTLVGAGARAYAGNQFGKGSGKAAATVGGAVADGVLGHAVTGN